MLGHQQVLYHRHFLEQANVLERPRQAGAVHQVRTTEHLVVHAIGKARRRDEVRRLEALAEQLDDVGVAAAHVEFDTPAAGLVEAGQAVEHGGLARAVGADQGEDLVTPHLEADIAERLDAAELHHQVVDRENDIVAHGATPLRGTTPVRLMRISPRGRQIIINTISTPNSRTRYSEKLRSNSGATVSTKAAITTPTVEPMPPSTTMARISADSKKVNDDGLTKPW
ncbi:hypothetical protein D3C79_828120 [compost metagenome]